MQVEQDLRGLFLDPEHHFQALRILAARRLDRGDAEQAFAFADRLCRLKRAPDPDALILRAEALRALGHREEYESDVVAAFAIDPTLPAAARLYLDVALGSEQMGVARLVLQSPRADRAAIAAAVETIFAAGHDLILDVRPGATGDQCTLLWPAARTLEMNWAAIGDAWSSIDQDLSHPMADDRWSVATRPLGLLCGQTAQAAIVSNPRARSGGRSLDIFIVGSWAEAPIRRPIPLPARGASISVIVPLFGDRRMTQLCLVSLGRQKREMPGLRVLLVNDNPDDAAMEATTRKLAADNKFEYVMNPVNLGFARSINTALEAVTSGDVLLLNADVVLPPGSIARLASAAASAPDVGTVTPLSNNGEETSFPSLFSPASLEPFRRICKIDRIAERENAERIISIANGVGFCLFVTRRALDALGPLPEVYERGYFEDVDYCLSAGRAGFRNICATNVYVGHKGARSFRGAKRALVVRNRGVLDRRFPTYGDSSAAFVAADPLRQARAAIERHLPPQGAEAILIVAPADVSRAAIFIRALGVHRCLCVTWSPETPASLSLRMTDGSAPQSLEFDREAEGQILVDYLKLVGLQTIHLVGPVVEVSEFTARLHSAGFHLEILFDQSFLRVTAPPDGPDCPAAEHPQPCEACVQAFAQAPVAARRGTAPGLAGVLRIAKRVRPMNSMARAVARHFSLPAEDAETSERNPREVTTRETASTLGVISPTFDVAGARLLQAIAQVSSDRPDISIVVFGECLDPLRLMSWPHVFVAGSVEESQLARLLSHYGVDLVFAPDRWSGCGVLERQAGTRPRAYFDWSGGLASNQVDDLALDPRLCNRKVAYLLDQWWRAPKNAA